MPVQSRQGRYRMGCFLMPGSVLVYVSLGDKEYKDLHAVGHDVSKDDIELVVMVDE